MIFEPMDSSLIWITRAALELFSKKNHGPEPSAWAVACRILADEGRIPPDVGFYLVARSCTDAANRRAPTDPQLRQITADIQRLKESYARTLGCPDWMVPALFEDEDTPTDLTALRVAFRRRYDRLIQEEHIKTGAQDMASLYAEDQDAYNHRFLLGFAEYRERVSHDGKEE